jgi:hypothetical protein
LFGDVVSEKLSGYANIKDNGTVRKTKKTWKFRVLFVVLQAEI